MVRRLLASSVLVAAAACGSGPSRPSTASYDGQWTGTTSQGTPISFTVSDRKLTTLTLGYTFNGCTGTVAVEPNVTLENIPTAPVPVFTADYQSGPVGTPNRLLIHFLFTSTTAANGMAIYTDYEGCGTGPVIAPWTATKR
jgi:hypothetical protein